MPNGTEQDDLTIVVERSGYGNQAWNWRLSDGMVDKEVSANGFSSAEEAYITAKAHRHLRRANEAYLTSIAVRRVFG